MLDPYPHLASDLNFDRPGTGRIAPKNVNFCTSEDTEILKIDFSGLKITTNELQKDFHKSIVSLFYLGPEKILTEMSNFG